MTDFNINLAANHVVPAAKRRKNFHLMLLYLAFCGLLLIDAGAQAGRMIASRKADQEALKNLQTRLSENYPDASSIDSYCDFLELRIKKQETDLAALNAQLKQPIPLNETLYALMNDTPPSIELVDLEMQHDPKNVDVTLQFHLAPEKNQENDPLVWLRRWKTSDDVKKVLSDLTLTARNDNREIGDRKVIEFSCTAELAKGGK